MEADSFPSVSFVWDSVKEDSVVYFMFKAKRIEETQTENKASFYYGLVASICSGLTSLIVFRKRITKKNLTATSTIGKYGKPLLYLGIVLGLCAVGFGIGYLIGFVQPSG